MDDPLWAWGNYSYLIEQRVLIPLLVDDPLWVTVFEDLAFDLQQDINAQIEQDEKDAHFDFQEEADRAYFQILRYRPTLQEFLGRNY